MRTMSSRQCGTPRALAASEGTAGSSVDGRLVFLVASGVVGGYFLGKAGYQHFFVDGITDEERRGVLYMGVASLALWAADKFLSVDKKYYSVDQLPATAQDVYQQLVR